MHAMINGKMHPEYKAKWLEALRSGEYKQGTGQLCTRAGETMQGVATPFDRYCCLGVLNEILKLGCADDEAALYREGPGGFRERLPILDVFVQNQLIHRNDDGGWSFAQIADWIEEGL